MFLLCDLDKTFSIIPAESERLMFRNDREIEVRVYKDKVVIVRKNDVFEKGGAMRSKIKWSVCIRKPPQRPINSFISRKIYVI